MQAWKISAIGSCLMVGGFFVANVSFTVADPMVYGGMALLMVGVILGLKDAMRLR